MVDEVNSCRRKPEWVVVGFQVRGDTGKPVICVLTCCERHRVAVERFQCTPEDAAMRVEIEHLDFVVDGLMETGEVYVGAAVPA
jgi:hypothetical protein